MKNRIVTVLWCCSLCCALIIFLPSSGRSTSEVDDSLCMVCHTADGIHTVSQHIHMSCSQCHDYGLPGEVITFVVKSNKCIACHPVANPGECPLIDFHQGMTDCLSCHADDCGGSGTTTTTTTGAPLHIDTCNVCHEVGTPGVAGETIHGNHTGASCSDCHNGAYRAGTVEPANCIVCHPFGNPGDCNLVNFHDPAKGGDCLACHIDCSENTSAHIESCLLCHAADDLHGQTGHSGDCAQCHVGTPGAGNVKADACIVCHPLGNTGTCNLGNYHDPGKGASCLECHFTCVGGGTTTTTTASTGGHEESGAVDDTLCLICHAVGSFGAQDGTIHGEHMNCAQCHAGGTGKGTVNATACIVCHPQGNAGKCALASLGDHGVFCTNCHSECGNGTSTTTTAPSDTHLNQCVSCHGLGSPGFPGDSIHGSHTNSSCSKCHSGDVVEFDSCTACHSGCSLPIQHGSSCLTCHSECMGTTTTTTASSFEDHINTCLPCHSTDDLHGEAGHSDCAQCHENDAVAVGKCAVCHPAGDPGKCNLANYHGSSCLSCHSDCSQGTTTTTVNGGSTTTTTIEVPGTIDIAPFPDSFFRSHFLPLPLVLFIKGTDSNFSRTTEVSFEEGYAIWPPIRLVLSPTRLFVWSLINPAGFQPNGSLDVPIRVRTTVDSGEGEPYEEVGTSTVHLIMLPFILDEREEKLTGSK